MRENRTSGSMRGCRKRATAQRACALLYQSPRGNLTPRGVPFGNILRVKKEPPPLSRIRNRAKRSPVSITPTGPRLVKPCRVDDPTYVSRAGLCPLPAPVAHFHRLPVQVLHADGVQQRAVNDSVGYTHPFLLRDADFDSGAAQKRHLGVTDIKSRAIAEMKSNGHERPSVEKLPKLFRSYAFILRGPTAAGKTSIHKHKPVASSAHKRTRRAFRPQGLPSTSNRVRAGPSGQLDPRVRDAATTVTWLTTRERYLSSISLRCRA